MNLLEIRTESSRLLSEMSLTASYVLPADHNKFINEGIKDMCIRGGVFVKTDTISITTTVASYVAPIDYLKGVSFLNASGVPLTLISPAEVGMRFIISGKPLYYYESQTRATLVTRGNSTVYTKSTLLIPATANGFMYEVTTAGQTGGSPPTYSTSPGTIQADGTAYITCRELVVYLYVVTLVDTPTTAGTGTGTYTLIYNALAAGLYVDTASPDFPVDKHHILVKYDLYRSFFKMKNTAGATAAYIDYCNSAGIALPAAG